MAQTSVDWLHVEFQKCFPKETFQMYNNNQLLYESMILKAKEMEKEQHSKTWDAALDTYEKRGHVYVRAWEDFDEYYNENFNNQ